MIVLPAMDLMDGRIVRLRQGQFDQATTYSDDPRQALRRFAESGASWVHVVDLDGARAGKPVQHALLADLAGSTTLKLQVAGGFRTAEDARRMFDHGVARVVLGSLCVRRPDLVRNMIERFGTERITLALDVRVIDGEPRVATEGWTETSTRSLWQVAAAIPEACHLLLTDIGRDGMMSGPNFALLAEAVNRLPQLAVQASGGISSLDDLRKLQTPAAILGKAMWDGRVDLAEAVEIAGA